MRSPATLSLKEFFLELAGTIVNASVCYDVWWELQNAENEGKYGPIVKRYFTYFDANAGAQLVAMIVLLYQAFETRRDTVNFAALLSRIEQESKATELVVELRDKIEKLMPTWKKVARARSSVIAHLSHSKSSSELMSAADLSPNEIGRLIRESKILLKRLAGHFELLGTAVLDMNATGHTRELMRALGAK